jgi:hypothetical protein
MTVFKGWNAKIYKDGVLVGYADSASVEIASNLEAFYHIGSRHAQDLVEGNEEVTGSFSKAWIDKNYLALVTATGALTEFTLCFGLGTGPDVYVYCYLCKFEKGALDIPQDGFLKEDYDFIAKSVTII